MTVGHLKISLLCMNEISVCMLRVKLNSTQASPLFKTNQKSSVSNCDSSKFRADQRQLIFKKIARGKGGPEAVRVLEQHDGLDCVHHLHYICRRLVGQKPLCGLSGA